MTKSDKTKYVDKEEWFQKKLKYPVDKWRHEAYKAASHGQGFVLLRGRDFEVEPFSLKRTLDRIFWEEESPIRVSVRRLSDADGEIIEEQVALFWEQD